MGLNLKGNGAAQSVLIARTFDLFLIVFFFFYVERWHEKGHNKGKNEICAVICIGKIVLNEKV